MKKYGVISTIPIQHINQLNERQQYLQEEKILLGQKQGKGFVGFSFSIIHYKFIVEDQAVSKTYMEILHHLQDTKVGKLGH